MKFSQVFRNKYQQISYLFTSNIGTFIFEIEIIKIVNYNNHHVHLKYWNVYIIDDITCLEIQPMNSQEVVLHVNSMLYKFLMIVSPTTSCWCDDVLPSHLKLGLES